MKKIYLILFSAASLSVCAQTTHTGISTPAPKVTPKFKKHLAPFAAFSYSVINNRKEVRGQYKPGVNVGLNYMTHPWFAWSAEYSSFLKHNSSPGFIDIKAWNTEVNGNLFMGMATSDLKFRFVFGACYTKWAGTYIGPTLNDDKTWYYGKLIKQDWLGANLGVGTSHTIGNHFIGYIDFRMRFASEKRDLVSISDTAFLFGIRWDPFNPGTGDKSHKKPRPSRIYRWLKKRNS